MSLQTKIQTFVFFDLETTGIPANQAKVTEITLISVSRSDIERANIRTLPAISKLSLLCNPNKSIQPIAAKITGLTNEFLKNQPVFNDNIKCINAFLDKPKPVCLIAHNGNRFDFKILQAEYQNANEKLPQGLLCIDTLNAFKVILKNPKYYSNKLQDSSNVDISDTSISNEDQWQDLSIEEIKEIDELIDRLSISPCDSKRKSKTKTPKDVGKKEEKAPKMSYKLCNIYETLLKRKPTECHRAEADCIMLLECALATKHDFLAYADSSHKLI